VHRGQAAVDLRDQEAGIVILDPPVEALGEPVAAAEDLAADLLDPGTVRCGRWTQADHGIWEIRGRARHYTHSRVAAWAGLLRAAALGERRAVDGNVARWRQTAGAIRAGVLGGEGALTLHDQGGGPDAAARR